MRKLIMHDRFGIGWRPELAAGILSHLDRIDVVEVIADDYMDAPKSRIRALQTLAAQLPVTLHGVGMGLASASPVPSKFSNGMARLVEAVQAESWSEHLSFVRAGGIEIGHLAATPRNESTVAHAARNIASTGRSIGMLPLVENIATLIDPPSSSQDEASWLRSVIEASGTDLLLDLHNLYANALNFGFDARRAIQRLPSDRIAAVHIAGGRWIRGGAQRRLLDDHLHDVPEPVFELLELVGEYVAQPLTIILERDGNYPSIEVLLHQLDRARSALARGRARQQEVVV